MKRILSFILCILFLSCAAWASAEEYTIQELMARQIAANSSYRLQLTAEAEGDTPAAIPEGLWNALKASLSAMRLDGTYFRVKSSVNNGNAQLQLQLSKNNVAAGTMTLNGVDNLWSVEGFLLPQKITLTRDPNSIYNLFARPQDSTWPSLTRALAAAVMNRNSEWGTRFEGAMLDYLTEINRWMQQYTATSIDRQTDGTLQIVHSIRIPLRDMATEATVLLNMLYNDSQMLGILRELLTEAEAALYLERGMLPVFQTALLGFSSSDEVVVSRRFDAAGTLLMESADLPFPEGSELERITLMQDLRQAENLYSANISFRPHEGETAGMYLSLNATGYQDTENIDGVTHVYTGELLWMPAQQAGDPFTVADENSIANTQGLLYTDFTLTADLENEQYNAAQTGRERSLHQTYTLLLRPKEGNAYPFGATSLTLDCSWIAGATSYNATRLNADLTLRDLDKGGALALHYLSRTSSPLQLGAMDFSGAVRLDTLSKAAWENWLTTTGAYALTQLTALIQ